MCGSAHFYLSPALGKRRKNSFEFETNLCCVRRFCPKRKKKENSNKEGEIELLQVRWRKKMKKNRAESVRKQSC